MEAAELFRKGTEKRFREIKDNGNIRQWICIYKGRFKSFSCKKTDKFAAVVVLPTPPFPEAIAMEHAIGTP